jgi:branched-chain amino acid transport system substrate-binding protein
VAIKEAAAINYPMDHFVGNWWSGSDADVIPAGAGSKGYKSAAFHQPGASFRVFDDIVQYVYNGNTLEAQKNNIGEVLYNRAVLNAMFGAEAVHTAQGKFGNKAMTGEQVRWGLENLNITEERLSQLGMEGFTRPVKVSCADHEGGGPILIQQWDGQQWKIVSDWIPTMRDVVRPMIEKTAAAYAKENNITPRSCS